LVIFTLRSKSFFIPQVTKELKNLNKKVVECTWDAKNNQWKFLRVREDKSFPNGYNTAMSKLAFYEQARKNHAKFTTVKLSIFVV